MSNIVARLARMDVSKSVFICKVANKRAKPDFKSLMNQLVIFVLGNITSRSRKEVINISLTWISLQVSITEAGKNVNEASSFKIQYRKKSLFQNICFKIYR